MSISSWCLILKKLRVEEAVGKKLAHDYSIVTPDRKGAIKKRGEVVKPEDVELLKMTGHYEVYVLDDELENSSYLFEEAAVVELALEAVKGPVSVEPVEEGKGFVIAKESGLILVNTKALNFINSTGTLLLITRRHGSWVKRGDLIAVSELVPLVVERSWFNHLISELKSTGPAVELVPSVHPKIGLVVVGNEIVDGIVKDQASPVVVDKLRQYECYQGDLVYVRDDEEKIASVIETLLDNHDGVILTGGMSVDPTDKTHLAIRRVSDEVLMYGVPFKPTTMSMIAYKRGKPVIGVSSGIIYFPSFNILDIVLPWVSAGVKIPREYLIELGNGGLSEYFLTRRHGTR